MSNPKISRQVNGYFQDTSGKWWILNQQQGWIPADVNSRAFKFYVDPPQSVAGPQPADLGLGDSDVAELERMAEDYSEQLQAAREGFRCPVKIQDGDLEIEVSYNEVRGNFEFVVQVWVEELSTTRWINVQRIGTLDEALSLAKTARPFPFCEGIGFSTPTEYRDFLTVLR